MSEKQGQESGGPSPPRPRHLHLASNIVLDPKVTHPTAFMHTIMYLTTFFKHHSCSGKNKRGFVRALLFYP